MRRGGYGQPPMGSRKRDTAIDKAKNSDSDSDGIHPLSRIFKGGYKALSRLGGIIEPKGRRKTVLDEKGRIEALENEVLHLSRLISCLAVICASNGLAVVLLAAKLL